MVFTDGLKQGGFSEVGLVELFCDSWEEVVEELADTGVGLLSWLVEVISGTAPATAVDFAFDFFVFVLVVGFPFKVGSCTAAGSPSVGLFGGA